MSILGAYGRSGGCRSGSGSGGSSFCRIARRLAMRGERGKRSALIVSRSTAAIAA